MLSELYRPGLGLLTDLYQVTMASAYWKSGKADEEAVFHLFYRTAPFDGEYAVAAGLDYVVDYLGDFRIDAADLAYLATLTGNDAKPIFDARFLDYLGNLSLELTVDAIPEGEIVFPHEPLLRVRGPLPHCQLVETALLNLVNFQTLIATKAARICAAARGDTVLEFGLRRAQGIDGALAASRAAHIGGCDATSNVLAGKLFDIPVKGTHAHSWVMSFPSELESFERYAEAMPNNSVLLVDTFDTDEGVRNAVLAGKRLRETGHELGGIRLDSGDLAELSKQSRAILDDAGFPAAVIVASNDLDEYAIRELKAKGAPIDVWGVGTRLVTAPDQPALGGVYKLGATRETPADPWKFPIKLSDDPIKITNPGIHQVRRFERDGRPVGDILYHAGASTEGDAVALDDPARRETIKGAGRNLLEPLIENGTLIRKARPAVGEIRDRALANLAQFEGVRDYFVGLDEELHQLKENLIAGIHSKNFLT